MWRVAIPMFLTLGCADPVTYQVTTTLQSSNAFLLFEDRLFTTHTETYEVSDYDELRDVAQTVTVRSNGVDVGVVLPFAASACGSETWMHSGELTRIEVAYSIYAGGSNRYTAYTESLTCIDDAGEMRTDR